MERIEEFDMLEGFRFFRATTQLADNSDGTKTEILTLEFVNSLNVKIDVDFYDGEYHIGRPYAVDDEYDKITGSHKEYFLLNDTLMQKVDKLTLSEEG